MTGDTFPLDVLSRWLHVFTAIVLLGGAVFQWLVLRPAARQLPDSEHDRLRELVLGKWRKIVGIGIGVLLLTGFYNYLGARTPADVWKAYHPVMGIKILLALAVFFLASALSGRSAAFAGIRKQAGTWLAVLVVLGAVIVALSGFLKVGGARALRSAKPVVAEPARRAGLVSYQPPCLVECHLCEAGRPLPHNS